MGRLARPTKALWHTLRIALGLILVVAAYAKARHLNELGRANTITYVMLGGSSALLIALCAAEAFAGVLLIAGYWVRWVAAATLIAFVAGFAAILYWRLGLDEQRSCGCFGEYSTDSGIAGVLLRHAFLIASAAWIMLEQPVAAPRENEAYEPR